MLSIFVVFGLDLQFASECHSFPTYQPRAGITKTALSVPQRAVVEAQLQ